MGSKPWSSYGEGKLNSIRGGSNINEYDKNAIRYTQNNDVLYAWFVSWPDDGKLTLPLIADMEFIKIVPLGSNEELNFETQGENLLVELPKESFGNDVWGLKLTTAAQDQNHERNKDALK